jgi:surface protein
MTPTKRPSNNTASTSRKIPRQNARKNIIKVRRAGGITLKAAPHAKIGDTEVIDGVVYTIRNRDQLRALIKAGRYIDAARTCTSLITDMSSMFLDTSFNQDIGHWDTSTVTDMRGMFRSARSFNQSIGRWDVSKVKNMGSMFYKASTFNHPIGRWDTSKVTNMWRMFEGALSFNQPIGRWVTSKVTDMSGIFTDARAFNQSIGRWDTSKVTSMSWMFEGALSFNQPIGRWDTSKVVYMLRMFEGALSFNQPIGRWDTSKVTDMTGMFIHARAFNQPIGSWDISKVTSMSWMFEGAQSFNQPIGRWDTSKVVYMLRMFDNARAFNQDIGGWDVSKVTNMSFMFNGARSFNQDLSRWRLHPRVFMDDDTRARIMRLDLSKVRFSFHPEFTSNGSKDIATFNHVPFNRAHIMVPELVKNGNTYHIRRVYDSNTINRLKKSGRTLKSPFTQAPVAPHEIVKLSTIKNKLVPVKSGNKRINRRLANQYTLLVTEAHLKEVTNEINNIKRRKISENAKKKILETSPLVRQKNHLEKELQGLHAALRQNKT